MNFNSDSFVSPLQGTPNFSIDQELISDEEFSRFLNTTSYDDDYQDFQAFAASQDYGAPRTYNINQAFNTNQAVDINPGFITSQDLNINQNFQNYGNSPASSTDYKYAVELQSQEYAIPSKEDIPQGYGNDITTKKTTAPEPEDDEHEIEYADDHDDDDEDYNDEASQDPGKSGTGGAKRQRKGTAGQRLTRWDPSKDQVILLAMMTYIHGFNIEFDWDQVAKFVQYTLDQHVKISGDAMKQHIEKMRNHREAVGHPCPPKIDRPFWGTLAGDSKEAKINMANTLKECIEASECKPSGGEIKTFDLLHIPDINAMPSNKAGLLHLPMPKGKKKTAAAKQDPKQPGKPGSKKRKSKAMDIDDNDEMADTPSKKPTQATKKKAEPRRKKRTHRKDLPLSADVPKPEVQQPGDQFALPEHVPASYGGDAQAWLGADGLGDDLPWGEYLSEGLYGP